MAALPASALAGGPGHWTRVTAADGRNIDQVAHARTGDGVLHTIWVHEAAARDSLFHTSISPGGTVGATTAIQTDWAAIEPVPDLVLDLDGSLRAFWGGIRSTDPSETQTEVSTATAPPSGSPWTLQPGNVTPAGAASYGADQGAATLLNGTPIESFGSTGSGVFVHVGLTPATPNQPYQSQLGGCCGYSPDIAVDGSSGQPFIAWVSNASGHSGVFAQAVDPASGAPQGTPMLMPGTATTLPELQRTPIVGRRGKPGVFVAYPAGYPTASKVLVWRVGSSAPAVVERFRSDHHAALAAAPDGRLWVVWTRVVGGFAKAFARRSNASVTAWGPALSLGAPSGAQSGYKIDADAQRSKLDVLGLFGGPSGGSSTWHTQTLPGLDLRAKPTKLRRGRKTAVTFTVTEPDRVKGAKVKAAGESGKTNAHGKVTLRLGPFGRRVKRVTATARKSGYVRDKLRLKVSR